MNGIDWLKTLHTKQLLRIKNECYEYFLAPGGYVIYNNFVITYEELKQVLSERPHIPNGAETKRIRQKAAKQKVRLYQSSKF